MRILVQGFGPFGRFSVNPSQLLVRALDSRPPGGDSATAGYELRTEVIATMPAQVAKTVPALMDSYRPDAWIGVGLAAGRPSLSLEAVAVNLRCQAAIGTDPGPAAEAAAEAAEAAAVWPAEPVSAGGPAAYLTTLPADAILAAWREAGIPGYLSQSAGTYLCNMSFYLATQAAERLGTGCMVGFVHVPLLPDQVEQPAVEPSMPLALQQAGLDLVLGACAASIAAGRPAGEGRPA